MKKIFILMVIFVLVFAGCGDEDSGNDKNQNGKNADIVGTWTGTGTNPDDMTTIEMTLTIANDNTWVLSGWSSEEMLSMNGTWYRNGNNLTLINYDGEKFTASISGNTLILLVDETSGLSFQFTKAISSSDSTSLKIQNESFSEITNVRWNSVTFTYGLESIRNGSFVTKSVQEGSGYIYFKRKTNPINARTKEVVVVEKNEQKPFTINDNTIIVDVDNPANEGTFGTLGINREPQITLKAGDTPIAQFGDYNFGGVLLNTDRDVTFTIGNSGRADLRFNVVEGNVINLSNNASGYFSVNQQPFASMTIAPGSTTTFVIRFSPKAVGYNFNAEVTIITNSENNAEFAFRVKGNGSNEYQIGDTGPGGGIVFFAQGGQYKECSGELGSYNWTNAITTAQNYRGGGLDDWHLPDSGELDLMYQNLKTKNLGGFFDDYYWSSTANGTSYAWLQYFGDNSDSKYSVNKSNIYRVRAVRSFSL